VFLVAWLGAEMPFLVAAFLDLGGCYCVASAVQGCRSMSCLTHNGRWHLTALSVGGGLLVFVTFLLVWLGVNGWLSSLVGTVVGGAGLVLVEQLLKPLCPALRIDADGEAKGG
jgi:hypothetical protein